MLHKLVDNGENLWPNDSEKRSIIYEKYKQYQVSVSVGFSFSLKFFFLVDLERRN
jgi:hypothetical protein